MKRVLAATALIVLAVTAFADPVAGVATVDRGIDSNQATFNIVQLARGLDHPWSFAFLPDGDVLITERPGSLWRYSGSEFAEVTGVPDVSAVGQGGLLDIIVDPDHEQNQFVYFSYSDRYSFGYGTVVARGRLAGARLTGVEELFRMNRSSAGGRHFGSRLAFGSDGMLYITLGDRGQQDRAQDTQDHAGTLLRIAPDGSVPPNNPFANGGGAPEIWSYGHRNAQGIALNPVTGEIWLHEHGPQGGDEINIARRGDNYGWPVITYGVNYGIGTQIGEGTEKPGMEQPVTYWVPSIAPSGMAFYTGDRFPEWDGDIFVGALAGQHLRRVELSGDTVVSEEMLLGGVVGRIRDVRTGPDGYLYFVTDESDGGLYRLEPTR